MSEEKHSKEITAITNRVVIPNDLKYLFSVREFMTLTMQKANFPPPLVGKIVLAIDEAVSNIIEHGYGPEEIGAITIEATCSPERIQVVIRDDAKLFNPETVGLLDLKQHFSQGSKRGLGIFLMRQIMDEVKYRFKEGKNELMLVKFAQKPGETTKIEQAK